jgi:hypothetical protein
MLSPRPGVTQEGHCQPGTGPTPQTLFMESSKVIPETDTSKAEHSNTQQGLPEFVYILTRI